MVLYSHSKSGNESIGQIFTPDYIAKFMVNNLLKFIKLEKKNPEDLKTLEPSVGKGIFLKYLIQNNFFDITAYELDKTLKSQLLKTYPSVKFKFENVLGSDINDKFDLIIGNPPYLGQNYNAEIFQEYVKIYPVCEKYFVGNMDLFYFFIHLGILKLKPGGFLSFITTNYWITKSRKTGIKLLKPHIIEECFLLQYVDLSHVKPFKGAKGQHNCIFVLQKKTENERLQEINKPIEIIQIRKNKGTNRSDEDFTKRIFTDLIHQKKSNSILKYEFALTNRDLKRERSWNLIYPKEVKVIIDQIEKYCSINGKISLLKDYIAIRNGLIFIKDSIFILKENDDLKVENGEFFIKINNQFLKLTDAEKSRLKKVYKSKSIKQYGYTKNDQTGCAIYFNKNEFPLEDLIQRNQSYENNYPALITYLKQFEKELREILLNAKENPEDIYFPRRGTFIRKFENDNKEKLIDLEPLYDKGQKIFFKFISDKNVFGYSRDPYYATSDTYFLWPLIPDKKIDYLFMLAYLNSKLVNFLFKAKNISIKRSKTRLEHGLPIPSLSNFETEKKKDNMEFIKFLTSYLIKINSSNDRIDKKDLIKKLLSLNYFSYMRDDQLKLKLCEAIKVEDQNFIQITLNKLFFQLFDLDENVINYLLTKYYSS